MRRSKAPSVLGLNNGPLVAPPDSLEIKIIDFLTRIQRPCSEFELRELAVDISDHLKRLCEQKKIACQEYSISDLERVTLYWAIPDSPEMLALKKQIADVEKEISQFPDLREYDSKVNGYISLLHTYNETKDTCQMIMGRLAIVQGVLTRDLYPKLGLNLDD